MSEVHNNQNIKVKAVSDSAPIWFIGWLFTIGFANLSVMQAIFAILLCRIIWVLLCLRCCSDSAFFRWSVVIDSDRYKIVFRALVAFYVSVENKW